MYLAASTLSEGEHFLASVLRNHRDFPVQQLREEVPYQNAGTLALRGIMRLDPSPDRAPSDDGYMQQMWVMLEQVPHGSWLPDLTFGALGPLRAVRLALSHGELLLQLARQGQLCTFTRPELTWATLDGDQPLACCMATRCDAFFRHHHKHSIGRLFDHAYGPLENGANETIASPTFPLARMIAEWATGKRIFPNPWYGNPGPAIEDGTHPPLELPLPLQRLLHRGLTEDVAQRMPLPEFLDELRALTPEQLGA
jgi:hypothetical protein